MAIWRPCLSLLALTLACSSNAGGKGDAATDTAATQSDAAADEGGADDDGGAAQLCPEPLADRIDDAALRDHLEALHELAMANGGNRAAGTPGYEASAVYIETQLEAAGYEVERWPFEFAGYAEIEPTELRRLGGEPWVAGVDFELPNYAPGGQVSAAVEAVDLELGPGNASTSGCQPEDFAGFSPGRVALVQRGSCTFATKAELAEAAGASAVLIFNQGDADDSQGLFAGTLGASFGGDIPTLFLSYARGLELAEAGPLPAEVALKIDADVVAIETFNVFAERSADTDASDDRVIMLGGHLDSVPAGPGINDNGSGSALVLELATRFAACTPPPGLTVRFAWWGGEEWGLHGSTQYVDSLDASELDRLAFYLNYDMVASPNYLRGVYSGIGGPAGSEQLGDSLREAFEARGLASEGVALSGNSDHAPFIQRGIAASGLFTGATGRKSSSQAETFGGEAELSYDPCYHLACDDQDNAASGVHGQNARVAAEVLEAYAADLGPFATAAQRVERPLALSAEPASSCDHAVR